MQLSELWSAAYSQSPSGVFGGGTIGYNMQRGGVVFGIEADFGDMGLSGSKFINAPAVILRPAGPSPTGKSSHFNGLLR